MAITHATATRNVLADAIDAQVNAGTADLGGDLDIKASSTTLVEITFQDPAFGAAAAGVITLAGVPLSNTAVAAGVADNFDVKSRDNVIIFTGTATLTSGGGDIELDNTNIAIGQTVEITSLTYTAPP